MPTRTNHNVKCSCGHTGQISMKENDAPFSSNWEKYSLIDIEGNDYETIESPTWTEVFKHMKPVCPVCNKSLTPENITD